MSQFQSCSTRLTKQFYGQLVHYTQYSVLSTNNESKRETRNYSYLKIGKRGKMSKIEKAYIQREGERELVEATKLNPISIHLEQSKSFSSLSQQICCLNDEIMESFVQRCAS